MAGSRGTAAVGDRTLLGHQTLLAVVQRDQRLVSWLAPDLHVLGGDLVLIKYSNGGALVSMSLWQRNDAWHGHPIMSQ
jgi:hypothetical protein